MIANLVKISSASKRRQEARASNPPRLLAATRRRINLRGRLEDYSNLKLVKINVYIYILSVETVSIIQDSVLLLERARQRSLVSTFALSRVVMCWFLFFFFAEP